MILPWRDVTICGTKISTSLTGRETNALRELATQGNESMVEIGSAFGYSAIVAASAMTYTAGHVFAVDPHQAIPHSLPIMKRNLRETGVQSKVTIVLADSAAFLPALARIAAPAFDLVFIDGDHSREAVAFDLRWAERLVSPFGTIAVHDYGEETCPGVKEAVDAAWPSGPKRLVDTLAIR